jgi:hypothetical protein
MVIDEDVSAGVATGENLNKLSIIPGYRLIR